MDVGDGLQAVLRSGQDLLPGPPLVHEVLHGEVRQPGREPVAVGARRPQHVQVHAVPEAVFLQARFPHPGQQGEQGLHGQQVREAQVSGGGQVFEDAGDGEGGVGVVVHNHFTHRIASREVFP